MKPLEKVRIKWSPRFAYGIGLLTTDGNLSSDRRHMGLVSKDREQIENIILCFGLKNKIRPHISGSGQSHYKVQFGDVRFYQFLVKLGLHPCKSKTINSLSIPKTYFFDFLRGHFDGDGTFYSYWDPRWKSSFMFYIELISASKNHVLWLQKEISQCLRIQGRITKSRNNSVYRLKYAKKESLKLLNKMYYDREVICLSRKRKKIENALKQIT